MLPPSGGLTMRLLFTPCSSASTGAVRRATARRWRSPASPTTPRSMPLSRAAARPRPQRSKDSRTTASRPSSTCVRPPRAARTSTRTAPAPTALGLKYIHIPFNAAARRHKTVDDFLAAIAEQGQSAGVHPLRIGQSGRRGVAGEARAAGRLGGRQGDRRSKADRPDAAPPLEQFAPEVHRRAQEVAPGPEVLGP